MYATNNISGLNVTVDDGISPNFTLPVGNVQDVHDGPQFDAVHRYYQDIMLWSMVLVCIYSTVGIVGNSLVIYVYYFKWKKTKTRVFILCLAIIDFINCSLNMPVEIAILSRPLDFDYHIICKLSRGITYILNDVGSTIFVAVAIERWLLVYRPLQSRQYTPTLAKKMAFVAFLVGTAFASPSFLFYGTKTLTIPKKMLNGTQYNIIGKTCLIADDMEIRQNMILIYTLINFALMVGIFVILTVLYIAIGRKIYLATCGDMESNSMNSSTSLLSKSIISAITGVTKSGNKNGNDINNIRNSSKKKPSVSFETSFSGDVFSDDVTAVSPSASLTRPLNTVFRSRTKPGNDLRMSRRFSTANIQATKKNTVMMRMVTFAFMMAFTPFLVILIIRYTNPNYELGLDKKGKIVYWVFLRSYLINSMVNPFIYGFMNCRFRSLVKEIFMNVFCSKCCRKPLEKWAN